MASSIGGYGVGAVQSFQTPGLATTTTLSVNASSPTYGQSLTFTATVTTAAAGTPTGSVEFYDGATDLGPAVLNGSGVATLTTSGLSVGSHAISAVYGGDANDGGTPRRHSIRLSLPHRWTCA